MSRHLSRLAHFQSARLSLLALAAASMMAAGCATSMAQPATVADTIASDTQLSTLSKLITQAGLMDTLKSPGPFTVFAPSNEAFNSVPAKTLDELSKDPAKLKSVLTFHVLPSKVMSSEVVQGSAKTVGGANIALAKAGSITTVDDAMVIKADASSSNGVVHTIDRVLMPPTVK
jgi:uncharacterized surface protein with fasciclin (FAS1) repeats